MKLLKVIDNGGQFLNEKGEYVDIDKITKDDLLKLASWTLEEDDVDFDSFDENLIKKLAHQIIYKSVAQRLSDLRGRRAEFIDESARLYLADYERYRQE